MIKRGVCVVCSDKCKVIVIFEESGLKDISYQLPTHKHILMITTIIHYTLVCMYASSSTIIAASY